MDILQGKTIVQKENNAVSADVALKKKNLLLYYFTSNNSEACRSFDPQLREVYEEALQRKVEIAIIVVPTDYDEKEFKHNVRSHYLEWFHVEFGDELIHYLTYNYGVSHIPSLIVVRKNGAIVTKEGVSDVSKIGKNVLVTWSE